MGSNMLLKGMRDHFGQLMDGRSVNAENGVAIKENEWTQLAGNFLEDIDCRRGDGF